jgi:uncharacterized tellurite resistance protein B-like protein
LSRILRFLGLDAPHEGTTPSLGLAAIEAELERLSPERARFFAAFAYLLARVADADLEVADRERDAISRQLQQHAGLSEHDARMVAELSILQAEELGGSTHNIVSRQFRELSDRSERLRLIDGLFAVAAADDEVSLQEGNEVFRIAEELGLERLDVLAVRSRYRDKLAEMKKLRGER